ncbi:amino acid dehydrogenase [Phycisphaerae bacterium]|jgi:glutamate dehydrogenase/leucine dehydrogenase|nr:amino acid dehydrogenase [Phycisphaerae bacterium]
MPATTPANADGFAKYQAFYQRPPAIVVEWHDDVTDAVGWLCIDSLRGGAAGGGTRMRDKGTREEAVFLAKTMAVKFRACGPDIGGGKSVIRFNAAAPMDVKHGVLERWYKHIGPYLKNCYGTGGDVGVDEVSEATAITQRVLGLGHVQEGIARGHSWNDGEPAAAKIDRLKHGVEALVSLSDLPGPRMHEGKGKWMVADVVTGLGVARSVEAYYKLRGKSLQGQRVIVEGFGAVGAFTAYYLEKQGAVTIAGSTRNADGTIRVVSNPRGLDVRKLINAREGTNLPVRFVQEGATVVDTASGDELLNSPAEIYIPAAASHTTTAARLRVMKNAGIKVVSCGANNPFAYDHTKKDVISWVSDQLTLMREADQQFAIIPDFIANCGMARVFNFLMTAGGKTDADSILADAGNIVEQRLTQLLKEHNGETGLLNAGYRVFIP